MPQCLFSNFWTDPEMLTMAMAALDQEAGEFHTDPARTYLTGLSMGGYGAWELARQYPRRWAAIAIAAGGPFWSYAPERWQQSSTMPAEYARAVGHTPVWMFHGSEDNVVPPRESDLMYSAIKANSGDVRLWIYQGLHHDSWARAYNEPELPKWLLAHRLGLEPPTFAERLMIPLHPNAIKLPPLPWTALWGNITTPKVAWPQPSSAREMPSTRKIPTGKSPRSKRKLPIPSSILSAASGPASPSSTTPRAASLPSSTATTATKNAGNECVRLRVLPLQESKRPGSTLGRKAHKVILVTSNVSLDCAFL